MKPFNENAICPKCTSEDIGASYHDGPYYSSGCSSFCPHVDESDDGPHIQRFCRNCTFKWVELPLDRVEQMLNPLPTYVRFRDAQKIKNLPPGSYLCEIREVNVNKDNILTEIEVVEPS